MKIDYKLADYFQVLDISTHGQEPLFKNISVIAGSLRERKIHPFPKDNFPWEPQVVPRNHIRFALSIQGS